MPTRLTTLGLFLATFAWGASFFLIKKATALVGVWPYLAVRFGISIVVLAMIFPEKLMRAPRALIARGFLLGLILFLCVWTQTQGLQATTATRSGFITALYVPFTPLLGWLLFRNPVYMRQVLATLLAVLGLYFLTNPVGPSSLISWWTDVNPGDLWTLACAILAAVHIVLTERLSREEADSVGLGMWQFIGCAFFLGVSILMHQDKVFSPAGWNFMSWPTFAIFSVGFNAVVCTAFAFIMQIIAQKHMGALKAALIFALEAPFSSGFAFAFLGETMVLREMIGALIVFLTSIIPEAWLKEPLEGT